MRLFFYRKLLLFIIIMISASCEKDNPENLPGFYAFPIGRSFLTSSTFSIKIDENIYIPDFVFDSCGGYWLQIPISEVSGKKNITIKTTRRKGEMNLFSSIAGDSQRWVRPSYYIDSDNEYIVLKANELTIGLTLNSEKAKVIQQFVINHVRMNIYKDAFLDRASKTYELGYGTCMNYSRLFVALCRAVKIPSRTIWGVVYSYNNDNIYDYHHQWAEVLDETGYWRPLDFNYTTNFDLNDIRYLDLIYAAEENLIVENQDSFEIMFKDLKYYNDYPVTLNARLGFELISDNRPDSMIVRYVYELK